MKPKVFITGVTGTVAPYVIEEFKLHGYEILDKHIRIESDEDLKHLDIYLEAMIPDVIIHLGLGPINYASFLSNWAFKHNKKFAYMSTVSVFEDNFGGPYEKDVIIDVKNPYGTYKYACEKEVLKSNPNSYIIRLGWQMSPVGDITSNNMFKFIHEHTINNTITVSDAFYPSASFIDDSAKAIYDIVHHVEPDLYLVNSNEKYSLFQILEMLKNKFKLDIGIQKENSFKRNDIMIDHRVLITKF
jgi:dTDP-4-dehydrorhamnose reductase